MNGKEKNASSESLIGGIHDEPPKKRMGQMKGSLLGSSGPIQLGAARKERLTLGDLTPPPASPTIEPTQTEIPTSAEPVVVTQAEVGGFTRLPQAPDIDFTKTPSAPTSWSPSRWRPRIEADAFVHPLGVVTGNVIVGSRVFIAAGAVVRGDSEEPIHIGGESNVQECAVLRDLPTRSDDTPIAQRIVDVGAEKYSLYIGQRVSICPQALLHGPAYVGDDVFVGMQALVFWARIEQGVVLEPGCLVMNVTVPRGVFVPAGLKVTNQRMVKDLPPLTSKYRFHGIGAEMVASNLEMLEGYRRSIR